MKLLPMQRFLPGNQQRGRGGRGGGRGMILKGVVGYISHYIVHLTPSARGPSLYIRI